MKISTRTILHAEEGMILTDGNTYGRVIMLGENRSTEEFREITEEEYGEVLKAQEEEISEVLTEGIEESAAIQEEETNGDNG